MSEVRPADPDPGPGWTRRSDVFALAFVGLALLLLLVVPVLTAGRTAELREQLEEVAEPTRDAITAVQYQLAREMSNLRAYLLTGDTVYLGRYEAIAAQQQETMRELTSLAARLGPETAEGAAALRANALRWQQSVTMGDVSRLRERPPAAVSLDQRLYEEATGSAALLDQAVGGVGREIRQKIREVERAGFLLTMTLAALAVIAVGVLVRFGRRLRALAEEAEARHGEAREALEATRRAFEARDRLARGVTHDVKNPLGAADGYAELLQMGLKGELSAEQATTVEAIRRSLRSALAIIDDLLDFARAERGVLPLSVREVSLNDLVGRIAESHRGAIDSAGQTLEVSLPSTSLIVRTDPIRVEQVVGNLLSNAAKYGGTGRVRVSLEWEGGPAGSAREWATVVVSDSGPGIPADQLDAIFTEFHRVDPSDRRGHGVGLAIARLIARQLGGELSVRSGGGAGATFAFRLPLDTAAHTAPATAMEGA